jgi:hypothetical protein
MVADNPNAVSVADYSSDDFIVLALLVEMPLPSSLCPWSAQSAAIVARGGDGGKSRLILPLGNLDKMDAMDRMDGTEKRSGYD